MPRISARHLNNAYPGPVTNISLLKRFDKYIRVGTAAILESEDVVCSRKIKEDTDYVLITETMWTFFIGTFGCDYTLVRQINS